jgi:hypothetical protein
LQTQRCVRRQETELEDCEQTDESGNRTGGLRTERLVRRQETEQEDCEERDETGSRTGELRTERLVRRQETEQGNLKECAGDFVVLTFEDRIFPGRIAQVKECGSLIKPCNMCG